MLIQTADGLAAMTPEQACDKLSQLIGTSDLPVMSSVEFEAWLDKLRLAEQSNPLLRLVWPSMDRAQESTRNLIVRRSIASAGLALLAEGPSSLLNHLDPVTGQTFLYRQTATGFELQSGYMIAGKPLVISFVTHR